MLNWLIQTSLKNRLLVCVLAAALMVIGGRSLSLLPIDAFPDTTPVQVQINTSVPALSPQEAEQQVTIPVELAVSGLPGLKNVRSISKFGLSQVVATFDDQTSIYRARQLITERLQTVELPAGLERPQLGPIATGLGEVFHYVVRSDNPRRTLTELRELQDWVIKPQLRKVPGVAEINSWGGFEKQYHVVTEPDRLVKYGLTLEQLFEALEANNQNGGGGQVVRNGESLLVQGLGLTTDVGQIGNIVIAAPNGVPVRVSDVATVQVDHEIRRGAVTGAGKGEIVLGLGFMLMGENSHVVTRELKKKLAEVQTTLPKDIVVEVLYDRTELVDNVICTVEENLLIGAALVIVVLFAFLGNLRAGLIMAAAIPLSMLFAVDLMLRAGIAASLLSLGAIDFGLLVNGAVVGALALLAGTLRLTWSMGGEFLPKLGEGAIVGTTVRVAGVSVEEAVTVNDRIEKLLLKKFPDAITNIWTRLGSAEVATDPMGIELSDFFLALKPRGQWKKAHTQAELVEEMRKLFVKIPGLRVAFSQPVLQIKVDPQAIARCGVPTRNVLNVVEAVGTERVGEIREGQRRFPLVVRLPDRQRTDPDALAATLIPTATGSVLPLNRLAQVVETEGPATINREWGQRRITVQCNVRGRDVGGFVAEARKRIAEQVKLPEGYTVEWGGQFENMQRANQRLRFIVPMVLGLILVLLYFSLGTMRDVFLVATGIPLGAVGGVLALWLRGMPFTVSAAVGFVALSGVATLNGLVLVEFIKQKLQAGAPLLEAVREGCLVRLRPVLMGALVAAAGFIPMAVNVGVGGEVQRPLATVVIGGVVSNTLLTLVVLPTLYTTFRRKEPLVERVRVGC